MIKCVLWMTWSTICAATPRKPRAPYSDDKHEAYTLRPVRTILRKFVG